MGRLARKAAAAAAFGHNLFRPGGVFDIDGDLPLDQISPLVLSALSQLDKELPQSVYRRAPVELDEVQLAQRQQMFAERSRFWECKDFKERFRLSRDAFAEALLRLEKQLAADESGRRGGGCKGHPTSTLEPAVVLAAGLCFAAGGRPIDIKDVYAIGKSTVYTCFWRVINAVNACPAFDLPFLSALDADDAGDTGPLDAISRGFERATYGIVTGCCGALDGWLPRLQKPPVEAKGIVKRKSGRRVRPGGRIPGRGAQNAQMHRCYKGYDSVNVQVLASVERRFLHASIKEPGSQPDNVAWDRSKLKRRLLERGGLGGRRRVAGRCFLGDDAYKPDEECITPWPGTELSRDKDNMNHIQSRGRMPVECAIGRLVGLWGIFWRPLRIDYERIGEVIVALMKLSNLMLDFPGESSESVWKPVYQAKPPPAALRAVYEAATPNIPSGEPLSRAEQKSATSQLRVELTARVAATGYHRPGCT